VTWMQNERQIQNALRKSRACLDPLIRPRSPRRDIRRPPAPEPLQPGSISTSDMPIGNRKTKTKRMSEKRLPKQLRKPLDVADDHLATVKALSSRLLHW